MKDHHGNDAQPNASESELLFERHKQGEPEALNDLFERHRPMLERVVRVRMYAKLKRFHEVDDLVQEALLAAFKSIDSFKPRGPGSFRAWLRKVTKNAIVGLDRNDDALKRGRDRLVSDIATGGDQDLLCLTERAADCGPSPSRASIAEQHKQLVDQALSKLPEREREVIILRQYLEHPWAEIVELLDDCPSEGAAQQLLQRARGRLNALLHGRRADLPTGLGSA